MEISPQKKHKMLKLQTDKLLTPNYSSQYCNKKS